MQRDLFDEEYKAPMPKKGLAIAKQVKQELTKEQKDFNRLVKKIEKLRADLERTTIKLDEDLKYYAGQIHPLEKRLVKIKTSGVKLFYAFYNRESKSVSNLSKKERKSLKEIIASVLDDIYYLSPNEPDEELKKIFKAINGESYDEARKNAFDEMLSDTQDHFRQAGFNINLDSMNENMSEAEMGAKMKEMQDEFMRQAEEKDTRNAARKKTKKQLEQEAREKEIEAARHKSISSIYKQLAKAFHPDLETDPIEKIRKEEIMKQLTVAYEGNDLHALLKLELEWVQKESNDPAKLSKDKLGIYNEVLKEQAMDLEMQMDMLEDHPRYLPLQQFARTGMPLRSINLKNEHRKMEHNAISMEEQEAELKGSNAVMTIKQIIRAYEKDDAEDEWDALLDSLMKIKMGNRR